MKGTQWNVIKFLTQLNSLSVSFIGQHATRRNGLFLRNASQRIELRMTRTDLVNSELECGFNDRVLIYVNLIALPST